MYEPITKLRTPKECVILRKTHFGKLYEFTYIGTSSTCTCTLSAKTQTKKNFLEAAFAFDKDLSEKNEPKTRESLT